MQTKSTKISYIRHVRQIAKTPDKFLTSFDKPLGILRKAANVRTELHPQTKMVLHGRCATCFLSSKFQPLRRGHHSSPMSKTGSCKATADGFAGRFYELWEKKFLSRSFYELCLLLHIKRYRIHRRIKIRIILKFPVICQKADKACFPCKFRIPGKSHSFLFHRSVRVIKGFH